MKTKRFLALLLSLCVVFSLSIGGTAFAEGDNLVYYQPEAQTVGEATVKYDITYWKQGPVGGGAGGLAGDVTVKLAGYENVYSFQTIELALGQTVELSISGYYENEDWEQVPVTSFAGTTFNATETKRNGVAPQIPVSVQYSDGKYYLRADYIGQANISVSMGSAFDGGFATNLPEIAVKATESEVTASEGQNGAWTISGLGENHQATTVSLAAAATDTTALKAADASASKLAVSDLLKALALENLFEEEQNNTVQIAIKASNVVEGSDSVAMDVAPYAIINNGNNEKKIENKYIASGASFTLQLEAPEGASYVDVLHSWDAYKDAAGNEVAAGNETFEKVAVVDGFATVTLSHFSRLTLTTTDAPAPAEGNVQISYMEASFGNAYDFHIYLQVPDFTYVPSLNVGGVRALTASTAAEYASNNVLAYTAEEYTNQAGNHYYDIHVKMFAKWLATPVYIKVMHGENEVAVQANSIDANGTVLKHNADYGYGYAVSDYVSLLGGDYAVFANEIAAYASHALSLWPNNQ